MTTKTYTVAHTRDSLIAIVPDGGDIQGAIDSELENYVVPEELDPDEIEVETGMVLTDDPEDDDYIKWTGHETGEISDENGTRYRYIVRR
jgi:hypothetical protein